MSALDESLLSLENLDRTSPELWPESSECDQPRSCSICLSIKRVGRIFSNTVPFHELIDLRIKSSSYKSVCIVVLRVQIVFYISKGCTKHPILLKPPPCSVFVLRQRRTTSERILRLI